MTKKFKKVVLFGGTGFIGGHVVDNLLARGIEVIIFDRFQKEIPLPEGVYYYLGDIRDRNAVAEAVSMADGAINLAGILGTSETVDNPFPSAETNITGGLNFLEACRQHKKPGVQIAVGNHFMNNTYAISKTTIERFALMYNKEHGTNIAIVRGLNAYGERQKHKPVRKIMPNFVTSALRGEAIKVFGDGSQVMDMIYVKDLADILVRALVIDHNTFDKVFEAGTGRTTTVKEIAEMVNEATENKTPTSFVPMRAGETENAIVVGNPETLKPLFDGKMPKLMPLEGGIARAVEWYKANYTYQED